MIGQREDRIDGGQVDDRARRAAGLDLRNHLPRGRLSGEERAAQIDPDDAVELGGRQVEKVGAVEHGGVVNQHVEPAGDAERALDQRAHLAFIADIAAHEPRGEPLGGQRRRGRAPGRLVDIGDHHMRALARKAPGDGPADTVRRSGHDRRCAMKSHCPCLLALHLHKARRAAHAISSDKYNHVIAAGLAEIDARVWEWSVALMDQTVRSSHSLSIPNLLTYARLAAVPLLAGIMFFTDGQGWRWIAVSIFALAGITDFLDGYLARAWSQQSRLGRMLDPIADKLLVGAALLLLVADQTISGWSFWAALIILSREILVSGLREFLAELNVTVAVSRMAKWKTTVQMAALCVLLSGNAGNQACGCDLVNGGIGLLWISAVLTLYTGFDYFRAALKHVIYEH